MSAYFLIAASGFFLAINFLFFVWDVIYYLKDDSLPSDLSAGTEVTQEVLRFVFVQGCFFALCPCYWRFPEPDLIAKKNDEIEPNYGIIDRTRMEPREIDTGESAIGYNEKERKIHEANDSSQILEADSTSNPISEKKGVLEADSANNILEAESNSLYEKV